MGTKNNPGAFDCYAAAHPDEPMFVLLGRDRHAPMLVTLWAWLREVDGEEARKVAEARECAMTMRAWRRDRPPGEGPDDGALLDWVLPIVTGGDDDTTNRRTAAVFRALLTGKDGREALRHARALAP